MPSTIALRPHDKVRLGVTKRRTSGLHPHNWHELDIINSHYYRSDTVNGGIRVSRAYAPAPPFDMQTMVTPEGSGDDWSHGTTCNRDRQIIVFQRDAGGGVFNVWETFSTDDAETWRNPVMGLPGCKYPVIEVGHYHEVFRAGYNTTTGHINASWCDPGDPIGSPSSFDSLRDNTGALISTEDDSFSLSPDPSGSHRWLLSLVVLGEGSTSDWMSVDNPPFTFKRY